MDDGKSFLKSEIQLSFEFLLQTTILAPGKNIFMNPIHLKFCGVLSTMKFSLILYILKKSRYIENTVSDSMFC